MFGDQAVESGSDSNTDGLAEAFPFANSYNGTTASISVYVDANSGATKLKAGVYANASGHPGSLIASGSLSYPKTGAWNNVTVPSAAVGAGRTYWIAVLGTGGTLRFRDRNNGPCRSENASLLSGALPSSWASGPSYTTCPISAYVNGYLTSTSGTTTTTTSTTTTTTTTTVAPPSNTALPATSGSATQAQTVSTSNGSWSGGPTSYAYKWRQCDSSGNNCADISGATLSYYTVPSGDVGQTLRAVVTATNGGGSASATSAAVATQAVSSGSCAAGTLDLSLDPPNNCVSSLGLV